MFNCTGKGIMKTYLQHAHQKSYYQLMKNWKKKKKKASPIGKRVTEMNQEIYWGRNPMVSDIIERY